MKKGALLESLETVLVVTVIAALIWLYAEGETTHTDSRLIKVRFVTPLQDMAASVLDENANDTGRATLNVNAVIQAARGDWARIDEWLDNNTAEVRVRVPQGDAEDQTFNLRDELNQSELGRINAFIKELDQDSVTVRVVQIATVDMPVQVDPGDLELSDESQPIPDPTKVTVHMPAALAQQVGEQGLKLTAPLGALDADSLERDTPISEFVSLELPVALQGQPHVRLDKENVEVRFIIRNITEELTLPRVQVMLLISDALTGEPIKLDEASRFLRVKLRGPTEAINNIRNNPGLVRFWVQIKLEDLNAEGPRSAPLQYFLPPGVKVVETEPPGITSIDYTYTPTNDGS